jgi:hypothetical protein
LLSPPINLATFCLGHILEIIPQNSVLTKESFLVPFVGDTSPHLKQPSVPAVAVTADDLSKLNLPGFVEFSKCFCMERFAFYATVTGN